MIQVMLHSVVALHDQIVDVFDRSVCGKRTTTFFYCEQDSLARLPVVHVAFESRCDIFQVLLERNLVLPDQPFSGDGSDGSVFSIYYFLFPAESKVETVFPDSSGPKPAGLDVLGTMLIIFRNDCNRGSI